MADIHLLCNAHLDPVWQWEWEEGVGAALSTFRAAADFCEEYEDFVFCHNEAILYQWIEEYEPALFKRIQKLVQTGKWKIMGGWYLQPDCNLPSGESMIRQIQFGRAYFEEKFGVTNTAALNFDPFGHSRGLVQILKKTGFDSYLVMRPDESKAHLPDDFLWVGFDGSEVVTHRLNNTYNSAMGQAVEKIEQWLKEHPNAELGLIPWGVGNHGGGPSRKDIEDINRFKARMPHKGLRHSTPEAYFESLARAGKELPRVDVSLNPVNVGCYTSIIRIKQQHRALENDLAVTERMLSHACMQGLMAYPQQEMDEAIRDLLLSEFHDILPGSNIQSTEETSLQLMHHGREIASRLRARAFFALAASQKPALPGEYPVLVYNPFPYEVEQDVEVEFMLADQNWKDEWTQMTVWQDGCELPAQTEKERSNITLDWRKRVVFHAKLKPMQMNRFDCREKRLPQKPVPSCAQENGRFVFDNGTLHAEINRATGLLSSYRVDGEEYLAQEAMRLLVIRDNADPWGMTVDRFRDVEGEFQLMDEAQSARFAAVEGDRLAPVRVIEDGPVRTVIEAGFQYEHSFALVTYRLPKVGSAMQVHVRLLFAQKDKMVKLSIPSQMKERYIGQTMFGAEALRADGGEAVAQQWVAAGGDGKLLGVINNGVYGSDCCDGEIRMSLLRSAGYCVHPIPQRPLLPTDRFSERIDQGERVYSFWLCGGQEEERMENLSRQAQLMNEGVFALSYFPGGQDGEQLPAAVLRGEGVQMTALRPARDESGVILRLFDASGRGSKAHLALPLYGVEADIAFSPFEVRTLKATRQGIYDASMLA